MQLVIILVYSAQIYQEDVYEKRKHKGDNIARNKILKDVIRKYLLYEECTNGWRSITGTTNEHTVWEKTGDFPLAISWIPQDIR